MLIHEVITAHRLTHESDPVHGHITQRVEYLKPGTTTVLVHKGVTYVRDEFGNFDIPDEEAVFFVGDSNKKHSNGLPTWFEGETPFIPDAPEQADADNADKAKEEAEAKAKAEAEEKRRAEQDKDKK